MGDRPVLLDLYCCQGGAAKGFHDAGFDVVGVDLAPQPRYPFRFIQADALKFLDALLWQGFSDWQGGWLLGDFAAIHASPPCQAHTRAQKLQGNEHPELIGPTRELLEETGLCYVIENVERARSELRDPAMLCGTMFGLEMYRHRHFETNWPLTVPLHSQHVSPQVKMGRAPKPGEFIQAVGNFSGVQQAREVMEMPWANRDGLREAIPPAYTRYIGQHLMQLTNRQPLTLPFPVSPSRA